MNILIAGNMGYVGPVLVRHLRQCMPGARITGFDSGYFAHCLTTPKGLPEVMVDTQHFGDLRAFPEEIFSGIDSVVLLAGRRRPPGSATSSSPRVAASMVWPRTAPARNAPRSTR
jgi:nucleoside-diphosphate-sugar epimerase